MQPFQISERSYELIDTYPDSSLLMSIAQVATRVEREWFLRLWVSEGIPFAFREAPIIYEAMREWIAQKLKIHPKQITVIGSARIGFCMGPRTNYGKPFDSDSDLDLTIVNDKLFDKLHNIFEQWRRDVSEEVVKPRHDKERYYWEDNLNRLPHTIQKGFIDAWKLPTFRCYPLVIQINNTMWEVTEKLKQTYKAPKIKKVSARIYQDWTSFVNQLSINFCNVIPYTTQKCKR
jgi:hypothetical protein